MNNINNIIDKILFGSFIINKIPKKDDITYNYYNNIKENTKNFTYEKVVKKFKKSHRTNLYLKKIQEIDFDLINKNSEIHGLDHILRTSIYALIISINQNISDYDLDIVLTSVFYHDIGRTNDIDDDNHGYNAISKLDFLKDKYSKKEFDTICCLIAAHCLDDDKYISIANEFNIANKKKLYKLLCIIKDADALDRVREYPYTDIKYLRTKISKQLLKLSYEIYYNYELNKGEN